MSVVSRDVCFVEGLAASYAQKIHALGEQCASIVVRPEKHNFLKFRRLIYVCFVFLLENRACFWDMDVNIDVNSGLNVDVNIDVNIDVNVDVNIDVKIDVNIDALGY